MKLIRKAKDAKDKASYSFFVVIKPEGSPFKLESGWDSIQEAKDMVKELPGYLNAKAFAKKDLGKFGLDPAKENNWYKG